jgi:hypothetical protein
MKNITDKVFDVIEILKARGDVRFYADVYRVMDMQKGNFNQVKMRSYDFTVKQLCLFINHYKINANHLFKNDPKIFDTNNTQIQKKSEYSIFSNN